MNSNLKKGLLIITLAGTIASQSIPAMAAEAETVNLVPDIGIDLLVNGVSDEWLLQPILDTEEKGEYLDIAFANVNNFLYVRSEPTKESEYVGKLYSGAAMYIVGPVGVWTPIVSGEVTGYVKTEYIVVGEQEERGEPLFYAESREQEELRLREEAIRKQNMGQEVVNFACQFIGNPYVWGGTSLTRGADCSGFVQSIYANFGVKLPRTSSQQREAGVAINYEDAMPGDLICYDGHIGIYIGDGQIVNARSPEEGIGISPACYGTILSVRRVLL